MINRILGFFCGGRACQGISRGNGARKVIEDIDAGNYKGEINNDLVCIIELGDIPYLLSERKAMVCT